MQNAPGDMSAAEGDVQARKQRTKACKKRWKAAHRDRLAEKSAAKKAQAGNAELVRTFPALLEGAAGTLVPGAGSVQNAPGGMSAAEGAAGTLVPGAGSVQNAPGGMSAAEGDVQARKQRIKARKKRWEAAHKDRQQVYYAANKDRLAEKRAAKKAQAGNAALVRTFPALLEGAADAAAGLARLRTELEAAREAMSGEQRTSGRWGDVRDFCFILTPDFLQQPLPPRKLPPSAPPSFEPLQWDVCIRDVCIRDVCTRWDAKALEHAAALLCLAAAKS